MKIANIKIHFNEKCPEEFKPIIIDYWKLEDHKLVNKPKSVAEKHNITIYQVTDRAKKNASLAVFMKCVNCHELVEFQSKTHSEFDYVINSNKFSFLKCEDCINDDKQKMDKIQKEFDETFGREANIAIKKRIWEDLNDLQYQILYDIVNINHLYKLKAAYKGELTSSELWREIYYLEKLYLIKIEKNPHNGYASNITFEDDLKKLQEPKRRTNRTIEFSYNEEINELKFRLTKNNGNNYFEEPLYAGVFTPKNDIILKANEQYTFGGWKRTNDELFITIIPTNKIYNHISQERIAKQPRHIRNLLNDYFSNIDFD